MWTWQLIGASQAQEPEIKLPTSVGSSKKQESSRKPSTSALLTTPKPLTVWITTNCGKFFKRWKFFKQTTWPASWEICMQVKKQQLELDIEQQTGSKSGKEYVKAVYDHPAYLTYMQSTSCEMLDWMKHKLEYRLLGEISITSVMLMTDSLVAQRVKHLLAMRDTWVWSLGCEDSLEKEMATQLHCSCLENPMDGGAWGATVHGVAKSRTWLSNCISMQVTPYLWQKTKKN